MRFLSQFSLAVALATGAAVAVAALPTDAAAQDKKKKKKKKSKRAKPEYSKAFLAQAGPIQGLLAKGDFAGAKPGIESLIATNPVGDDAMATGSFAVQTGGQLKDKDLQEKGVNLMLASGKAAPGDIPQLTFFSGNFAYNAGRYAEAKQKIQSAVDAGYTSNGANLVLSETHFKLNDIAGGLRALERAAAVEESAGKKVPEAWFARGAGMAARSGNGALTSDWGYKLVEAYPTATNWRSALSIYRDSVNLSNQENLELMRLMRHAGAMVSERDYQEYAEAADPRRLPGEVVALIKEGRSKGDLTSSNLYFKETLQSAQARLSGDRGSLPSSERDSKSSANGKTARATADAYLGYGNYQKAVSLYQLAMTKGGVDTNRVNMGRGIASALNGDFAGANSAFGLITATNRAPLARLWSLWATQKSTPVASAPAAGAAQPES